MATVLTRSLDAISGLFDRSFDPARSRKLPLINDAGLSNVRGLYMAGEIAGTPLIKLGLNRGRQVVEHIVNIDRRLKTQSPSTEKSPSDNAYDILIVGAGCAGLGAADKCQELGLNYMVIDSQRPAQLVRNMTKSKPLLMEPPNEKNQTRLYCQECKKEELLEKWDAQIVELGLHEHIHQFETVTDIQHLSNADSFKITTDKSEYTARRVILAIGKAGNPRKLNVPGELDQAARISQNVADPDVYKKQNLLVFGAGDVACEAAIALANRDNHITMVAPDKEFTFPKKRNIDAVTQYTQEGKINLYLNHVAQEIGPDNVVIKDIASGKTKDIPCQHIFRCIGAEMPMKFFNKVGIKLEGTWDRRRWGLLMVMFLICYFIYGAKTSPALWPFNIETQFFGNSETPMQSFGTWWQGLHIGEGTWSFKLNGSFWYSLAYCVVMTIFGLKAYFRWGVGYQDDYQKKRFATLILVQWILAFLIPNVLMWWVHGIWPDNAFLGGRNNWWHASGFEYAFPLFFWQFFWDVGWLYLVYGMVATLIVIPIMTIRHGKRYCTWFCGCGGLAETLADPWRHLAPKGKTAQRWEWMNFALLIWAVAAIVLVGINIGFGYWITGERFVEPNAYQHGTLTAFLYKSYKIFADVWLVGIIPVTLYPIYGGKIWCRYWCPLAKWMQMTSKWFGSLQISSNEKCITCGECSRYCEVGIDVMAFAKNQASFSNETTACIQCGICITACPMDVLSFDNQRQGTLTRKLIPLRDVKNA